MPPRAVRVRAVALRRSVCVLGIMLALAQLQHVSAVRAAPPARAKPRTYPGSADDARARPLRRLRFLLLLRAQHG